MTYIIVVLLMSSLDRISRISILFRKINILHLLHYLCLRVSHMLMFTLCVNRCALCFRFERCTLCTAHRMQSVLLRHVLWCGGIVVVKRSFVIWTKIAKSEPLKRLDLLYSYFAWMCYAWRRNMKTIIHFIALAARIYCQASPSFCALLLKQTNKPASRCLLIRCHLPIN